MSWARGVKAGTLLSSWVQAGRKAAVAIRIAKVDFRSMAAPPPEGLHRPPKVKSCGGAPRVRSPLERGELLQQGLAGGALLHAADAAAPAVGDASLGDLSVADGV